MKSPFRRAVSLVVMLSMLFTQSARADLSAMTPAVFPAEKSLPFSLELPFELGSVDKVSVPHSGTADAYVVLIQTMHGHYEAALKIKGIVQHLQSNFGIDLMFAEGASGPLHPEYLSFTADVAKNAELLDELVRKGEMTGADLALSAGGVSGVGIENPSSYRYSYSAYKNVLGQRQGVEKTLETFRLDLDRRASRLITPELREILSRWLRFGSGRLDLMTAVDFLRAQAPLVLGLDFEAAFTQFDWPQVTRLVLLSELGKKQNQETWEAEKAALIKNIEALGLDTSFPAFLEARESAAEPRRKVEQFMQLASPAGLKLTDYPQAVYRAASRVLESEIDSRLLYEEISRLFEKILSSAARSQEERILVDEYQRLRLADKLLRLELSPQEWGLWRQLNTESPVTYTPSLEETLRRAEEFYRSMDDREQAFLEVIDQTLRSSRNKSAVLVTGGFHGPQMMDKLQSRGISSVLVTPHISGNLEQSIYQKIMLRGATLEQTLLSNGAQASVSQGWDVQSQSDAVRQVLRDQGIEVNGNTPYFTAVHEALLPRSELRSTKGTVDDALWDDLLGRSPVDGKITDTRDREGNMIGKFASTPSPYVDSVFEAMKLSPEGPALVVDAGHGTGNLLFRFASRAGKLNPKIRFVGIEGSPAHYKASADLLKKGVNKKLLFPGQVELRQGDFNQQKDLFRKANVVYYAEAGTRDLQAFSETLHELQPGARVVALGEDQSQPERLRELLTKDGAFDAESNEGFPKITVYTRRSELRTEPAEYQLAEKEFDVRTLFPANDQDKPLEQIVFISDNTGTMVENYGEPLAGTILSDAASLLNSGKASVVINSGDPLRDLSAKTYKPLLDSLTPEMRTRFHIVADGGSRRIGFKEDGTTRYFDELESWPKDRRFVYARVLADGFYKELKKRKGRLAEGLKDVTDEEIDGIREERMKALEALGPEGWGEKKPDEAKFMFDLMPENFQAEWGRIFVYDVGPKVSLDAPAIRDYLPADFMPGVMAEVQKTYAEGTDDLYVVSVPGAVDMARVSKVQGVEKTLAAEVYPQLDASKPVLMVVIGDGDNDIPTFSLKSQPGLNAAVVPVFLRDSAHYADRLPRGTWVGAFKLAGTAQVLRHLAAHAGKKISDIPPLKLRQWVRSELRSEGTEAIGLDGRLEGLDLYERVFSKAPDTALRVGRDIAHTGALQASAIIKGIQAKRRAYDASGQKDRDIFIIFATGNTQWLGLTTLASILDSWGSWDDETRQLLIANGVDLSDKPDMGRVFATHLDTIFPQSRDDYYSYANELHSMFDKLGISRDKRRMFYGDVKNDQIETGADNQMDKAAFEKVQASIDEEGLKLNEFLSGQLASDHAQYAYLDAVNRYTEKMSEFVLARGPDIALFSAGPSYEGKGHFAFNEAGTPFDQGLVMALLSYHAAAGNIKDRGGMQHFRTPTGAIKIGGATLGPKEIRSNNPIFITIINGKEKRESVRSLVERPADIQYPMTALQSGAPGSVLIMESASGSTLRYFTNTWDFVEIPAREWIGDLRAKLFVRLSKETGKPVSALTVDDWINSPGKDQAEIAAIRTKNLIALTTLQPWEILRDEVVKTLAGEPLKSEQVPARLGLRAGDEIVHIGPHLDDLSLAAQFLVTEFSNQGHRLYSYYTAPGYTAVSDEYVLSALGTLKDFKVDELAALADETRSVFAFKQSEEKYLRQLIKVLAERTLVYDPMNYDTWSQMPAEERKLRAKLLFLRLNSESSLKGQISSPERVSALRDALGIYIKAKPHWGSSEIVVMQKLKVALRFVEEQTELMSRGVGYDDIFFPFQSSWYALERKGTARQSDIDVIKDVIRSKKPRMVIVNGEGFMDHGAHSITEMTVKVAVKELYEEGSLPDGFRMFFYRGVWDRAEITGRPDQILVALGEEELIENKSSFVRNYPSQAPALVPDASVKEPMFFSDQVVTNARETLAEWAGLNGRKTDDPALQGILAFDMIDFNSRSSVEAFLEEVVAKKAELDRVQVPINRASLSKIIGSAPPYADLSGDAGDRFLSILASAGFPYEQVLTKEEAEKTRVLERTDRSELRTEEEEKFERLSLSGSSWDFDRNPFPAVEKLGSWLSQHRWFMEKGNTVLGIDYADAFILGEENGSSVHGLIVRLRLASSDGREFSKTYFIPVIVSEKALESATAQDTVRVDFSDGQRYLTLAEHTGLYQRTLLKLYQSGQEIFTWNRGRVVFSPIGSTLSELDASAANAGPLGVSTSNVLTKVVSAGASVVSKTYKDMRGQSGEADKVWPSNTEVPKYEALVRGAYPYMPPLYGTMDYVSESGQKTALGLMMKAVSAETEAGGIFWEGLTRFMKALKSSESGQEAAAGRPVMEGAALFARELAVTVAGMHSAFLKSGREGFTAAPAGRSEIQDWEHAGQQHLTEALSSMDRRVAEHPGDENLKRLRTEFEKRRETVALARTALERYEGVLMKAPVHGDLSTAQGLIEKAGDRALNGPYWDAAESEAGTEQLPSLARELIGQVRWLDFEGPPAKESVAADFDQRENWIKDAAGVLEGFWYIANIQFFTFLGLNPQERPEDRDEARKASLVLAGYADPSELKTAISPGVVPMINQWVTETTDAFLDAYFDELEREGYAQAVLSRWNRETARELVDYYLLERAAHEFYYEFYAREWGWEGIPGTRLLQLVDSGRLTSEPAASKTFTASESTVFGGALTEVPEIPEKEFFSPVDAGIPVDGVFLPFHHMRHADDWGIGNFHTAKFAGDFARSLGYHVIQDLPYTYSSAGNSPYSVLSALLMDPVYLSVPEAVRVMEREGFTVPGWTDFMEANQEKIRRLKESPQIDHQAIIQLNLDAMRLVWEAFRARPGSPLWKSFEAFKEDSRELVEDDLLYLELKREQGGDWRKWEKGLRDRDPSALEAARARLRAPLDFQAFVQFVLDLQKKERDEYYRALGLSTMVDMAFAPPDAEIWKNPAVVGMKKEENYRRDAVQGVPGKKEAPVGQLWNFSVYDWANPAALELFIKVFRVNLARADYLRVDHTLGLYRIFVFLQKGLSLSELGLDGRIQTVREAALRENTPEARARAVSQTWELIRSALIEKGREAGLPEEVFTLFFDEAGQLRKGGNMVMAVRKVPKEKHGESLPLDSRWQRLHWEEDDLFEGEPKWDTIRLTPNERAQDNGDIETWLFPGDGREPPRPDDQIRLGYFRLSPGETAMSELARIAQEKGKKLIFETLGTVPEPIQRSSSRFGNNYFPLVYGLDPSSWYNPLKIKTRSGMMTFNVADTGSPSAAWESLRDWFGVKGPMVRAFFPDLPGDQFDPHMRTLTPEVHEKLLQLVYDPQGIYPQIQDSHLPLIALLGLMDIANLPENYRLNIPGQASGQWVIKLPEQLSLENLTAAAKGMPASESAQNSVRLIRELQKKRERHSPLMKFSDTRVLRTSPDVEESGVQIRRIASNPALTEPFFVESFVLGSPQRVELVIRAQDGREARFDARSVHSQRGGEDTVSNYGVLLRPEEPGIYEFHFEITKPDQTREITGRGRLIAVPESGDLNPMSPNYILSPDARTFRSELRAAEEKSPGWLREELGMSEEEVISLASSDQVRWRMRDLHVLLSERFPGRLSTLTAAGGSAAFAYSLGLAAPYKREIERVYDQLLGYAEKTSEALALTDFRMLNSVYEKLSAYLGEPVVKLSDRPVYQRTFLREIPERLAALGAESIPRTAEGKPHLAGFLKNRPNTAGEEEIRQALLEWLSLPDSEGKTWNLPVFRAQILELFPEYDSPRFDHGFLLWTLDLALEFNREDDARRSRLGGVDTFVGQSFGFTREKSTRKMRALREHLEALALAKLRFESPEDAVDLADYVYQPAALGQIQDLRKIRALEALSAEAGRSVDAAAVLEELASPELRWNIPEFYKRHTSITWLRTRGYHTFFYAAQMEIPMRRILRERYDRYAGNMKLVAESFGMDPKAMRDFYAAMGMDPSLLYVSRGHFLRLLGQDKQVYLDRVQKNGWTELALWKEEVVAEANQKLAAAGDPQFALKNISHADIVWGLDLAGEFLKEFKRLREAQGMTMVDASRAFGFTGEKGASLTLLKRIEEGIREKNREEKKLSVYIFDSEDLRGRLRKAYEKDKAFAVRIKRSADGVWETLRSGYYYESHGGESAFVGANISSIFSKVKGPYKMTQQDSFLLIEQAVISAQVEQSLEPAVRSELRTDPIKPVSPVFAAQFRNYSLPADEREPREKQPETPAAVPTPDTGFSADSREAALYMSLGRVLAAHPVLDVEDVDPQDGYLITKASDLPADEVSKSWFLVPRSLDENSKTRLFQQLKSGGLLIMAFEEGIVPDPAQFNETKAELPPEISNAVYGSVNAQVQRRDDVIPYVIVQKSRSELRQVSVLSERGAMSIPSVRLPFIGVSTGRADFDTALMLAGMADPLWQGDALNDYRLALRGVLESYYQTEGGEGFEEQVSKVQSVLRDSKQVIALFAHIEDLSADSALRQIFETAAFLAGENQAKAHYVVLTVDRAEDAEILRDKLLTFLREKHPQDAGLRNQLYARLPVAAANDPAITTLLPRGALSAWVDWNSGRLDSSVVPETAREKQIRADQLPSGEVLQFDEINRGYGVSLLQAALLLLQGEEDSRLQQIRNGIYAQSSKSALAGIGQVLKALQLISKSA